MNKIRKINTQNDLDKLINFTYTFCLGLIKPLQVRYELLELLKKIEKEKPKYILEIGTESGGTLFLFSRIASKDAVIISIDLPSGRFGGGYSIARTPLYKAFASKNQQIHLIRGNSHKKETLEAVKAILDGREIDFLFIDGDHTYKGVKKDFEMYSLLVRKNGMIALHDIIECRIKDVEVDKFWNEIEPKYDNIKIVKNYDQKWAGIGLIRNDFISK
jgi:predicted O-methyltransferase YrrM